jgi:GT2 family glycosyltransferase
MEVTIIIPNYNGSKYINNCLDSLLAQSFKQFQIVFVDNASKDDSVEIVKTYFHKVKLIQLTENYGFSKAVNEGIKVSDSKFVVLLNNDTVVEKDWLKNLVACIEEDKKIFSCCSKMIRHNERDKIDDAGDEYTILGWALKRGDGAPAEKYNEDKEVFSCCAGAAIYRRETFNVIGAFDENFFAYLEDVDISYRAKIYGYKNIYCSNAIVYHIGSATSGSKYNRFKIRIASRNNIYVLYKNMPFMQIILNLPFLVVGILSKSLLFTFMGYGKEYIFGVLDGIKNIGKIMKVRYKDEHFMNYIKIQAEIVINTFKFFVNKI